MGERADLTQEIEAIEMATTVVDSAIVLVNSIPAMLDKAKEAALENGATAEMLEPLSDLSETLREKTQVLAEAIVANTPDANAPDANAPDA